MISSLYWLALFRQSIKLLQYSICNRVSREFHLMLDSQDEVDEAEALRRRLKAGRQPRISFQEPYLS